MNYMTEANAIAEMLRGGGKQKPPEARRTRGPAKRASAKQLELLQFMREFLAENDQLPPYTVIGSHFGLRASGVQWHLNQLERLGYVERNAVGKLRFARGSQEVLQ